MFDITCLDHETFMREALREAEQALALGDNPIGAVIVHAGHIVSRGRNTRRSNRNHLAHAELNALLANPEYLGEHLKECVLYTTVEPCPMCLGAIVMADIPHVVFGAFDYRAGAAQMVEYIPYVAHHIHTYLGGILETESLDLIRRADPEAADIISGKLYPMRTPR